MNPFAQQAPIENVKNIIAVGSGKGGVGKSTVSINLACALKNQNLKVGILDTDLYGPSLPRLVGALHQKPQVLEDKIQPLRRYGLTLMSMGFLVEEDTPVIWRGPMLFKAIEQMLRDVNWGELDCLIVDLPPGTGDIPLTLAQKIPLHGAVIVSTPQNISLVDARKAVGMFEQLKIPILGVVENMSGFQIGDQNVDLFPRGDLDTFLKTKNLKKLATIAFDPALGITTEAGIPLMESDEDSVVGKSFKSLAKEIASSLNGL